MRRTSLVTTGVGVILFIIMAGFVLVATNGEPTNSIPSARFGHTMVHDESNEQVILFGGSAVNDGRSDLADTWMFSCTSNTWTELNPTSSPSARAGHSMVYDSVNQQVILFGGWSDETWIFDPQDNEWTKVSTIVHPSARHSVGMYYDPFNEKVVLFGGYLNDDSHAGDTWIFDPVDNTWTEVFPVSKPTARYGHSLVYDTVNQQGILFGGRVTALQSDTWAYNYSSNTWTKVQPVQKPVARYWHAAVYNPDNERMILFGGDDEGPGRSKNDIWTFDPQNDLWTELFPETKPVPRMQPAMVYDSLNQRILLFGGLGNDYSESYSDTWEYDYTNNNWIHPTGTGNSGTNSPGFDLSLVFAGLLLMLTINWKKGRKRS
ncbi:MAG: Kelch repeat-containing protein [Candidatus Hodarchaeales archaeon]|jgi:N-acetylneuraminic acid mutarotase